MPRASMTDGAGFPTNEDRRSRLLDRQWLDTDGDGVRHARGRDRNLKGRALRDDGLPLHKDNQTVVKERNRARQEQPDILVNEITTIDNALTRPWTVIKKYRASATSSGSRTSAPKGNAHVAIGKENIMLRRRRLCDAGAQEPGAAGPRYFQRPAMKGEPEIPLQAEVTCRKRQNDKD